MLIIAGTSLQVYPAAGYVHYFKGDHLVIINKEELNIPLNTNNDLFIQDSIGKVFSEVEKEI